MSGVASMWGQGVAQAPGTTAAHELSGTMQCPPPSLTLPKGNASF